MNKQQAGQPRSHVAQSKKIEYRIFAVSALLAALILGGLVMSPRVMASTPTGTDLAKFYSQLNIPIVVDGASHLEALAKYSADLSAHIAAAKAAHSAKVAQYWAQLNVPFGGTGGLGSVATGQPSPSIPLVSAARSAELAKYYAELNIAPFVVSASRSAELAKYYAELNVPVYSAGAVRSAGLEGYYAQLNVPVVAANAYRSAQVAGFYAQLDVPILATGSVASAQGSGLQGSVDAETARWVALGESYSGKIARGMDAETPRWVAKGIYLTELALSKDPELVYSRAFSSGSGLATALQPTDVSKFYAERMRVQAQGQGVFATSPSDETCSAERSATVLGENPELVYVSIAQSC